MRLLVASVALLAGGALLGAACSSGNPGPEKTTSEVPSAAVSAVDPTGAESARPAALTPESPDAGDDSNAEDEIDAGGEDTLPGTSEGCPDDMVLVDGDFCPAPLQRCIEYHPEYLKDEERKRKAQERGEPFDSGTVSERCLRYQSPSICVSKERHRMRYCMDRYEFPNKKGELPMFLISWLDARKTCEDIGKRLCTDDEFSFACEGEAMLPYTYGYVRDASICNIDKAYRRRERTLRKYERCMKKPSCKAEIERLDQRVPSGSMAKCVSPFGVYDLNGNMNEWVLREGPKVKEPFRSGLKGGWWGPVRSRCRPTVGFHKEDDLGYEEGFRCCKDAEKK